MKQKKSLESKIKEDFPEFFDTIRGMSDAALDTQLATLAKNAQEVYEAEEADIELEEAKKSVTFLAGPYKDAKKAIKLKTKFIVGMLKDRGKS